MNIKKDARTAGTDPDALKNITLTLYIHFGGLSSHRKKDNEMAYMCTYGKNQECDGCLDCRRAYDDDSEDNGEPQKYRCEDCGDVAEEDGYYYDVEGLVLCGHCLDKRYRKDVLSA